MTKLYTELVISRADGRIVDLGEDTNTGIPDVSPVEFIVVV
jgi:hypothetical protein